MGKGIAAWSILICCSLTSAAEVTAVDDYVVTGRQDLVVSTTCDVQIDGGDVPALKACASRALLAAQFALQLSVPAVWPGATNAGILEASHGILPAGPATHVFNRVIAAIDRAGAYWRGAVGRIAADPDPRVNEFVYSDIDLAAYLEKVRRTLTAVGDFFLRANADLQAAETFDVYDAERVLLGRLTLAGTRSHVEGAGGRMALADGRALEVEWFGALDEDQVGVSLFAADRGLEGWFEGTMDSDRGVISDGTLDLWFTFDPVGMDFSPSLPEAPAYLDATLAWTKTAWAQLREVLTPAPAGTSTTP